ncbi:MAG: hypothetical protein K6E85_04105 [Lachnospiraceae bacterium]|nr:hypothetical protein [Lachnospiraceae bacterium]
MKNKINTFDETKVTIEKEDESLETAWYDITDIVKEMLKGKKSILEYVTKIEMEIYNFLSRQDYGNDRMKYIRESFEKRIKVDEYDRFMCIDENGVISVYNDARSIRLTFNNGAVLVSSNSEWGGISMQ